MVFLASTDYLQRRYLKKSTNCSAANENIYDTAEYTDIYVRFEGEDRRNMLEYIYCSSNCLFVINDEERLVFATTGGCL